MTCQLLGVVLEESTPEELKVNSELIKYQKYNFSQILMFGSVLIRCDGMSFQEHVTVRSSAVEVLLEIGKVCDIYLMEMILDDDSEVRNLCCLQFYLQYILYNPRYLLSQT